MKYYRNVSGKLTFIIYIFHFKPCTVFRKPHLHWLDTTLYLGSIRGSKASTWIFKEQHGCIVIFTRFCFLSLFKLYLFCMDQCGSTCRGQRLTLGSQFLPSTLLRQAAAELAEQLKLVCPGASLQYSVCISHLLAEVLELQMWDTTSKFLMWTSGVKRVIKVHSTFTF